MKEYEKVPWSCRKEWKYCRDRLFGDDQIMQRKALEHLYVWKIRNYNLPVAVECTLILMEAKTRESLLKSGNVPDMSMAMWYSTPITRFINLVTDSNVGVKTPTSMMDFAKQLGIPDWIVELRHTAAHGHSLPKLSKLKEATDVCLKWLRDNYWYKNESDHHSESEECKSISPVDRLFYAYKTLKLHLLRGSNLIADLSDDEKNVVCLGLSDKMRREKENSLDGWNLADVYEVIIKRLSRILIHEEHAKELIDHMVTSEYFGPSIPEKALEDDNFLSPNMVGNDKLREIAIKKWADLLNILCNSSNCLYLLRKLFRIIGDELECTWSRKCAFAYANAILEAIYSCKEIEINKMTKWKKRRKLQAVEDSKERSKIAIVNVTITDEQIGELMRKIAENPNQFTETILKNLSRTSKNDELMSGEKRLAQLISIYTGKSSSIVSENTDSKIHTVEELKQLLGIDCEPSLSECIADSSELTIPKEESVWSNIPLGLLPGESESRLWMKIYEMDVDTPT